MPEIVALTLLLVAFGGVMIFSLFFVHNGR